MSAEIENKITADLYVELTNFLYQESYFLDNRKYKEWLEMLSDDLYYRMPLRETLEGVEIDNIADDSSFFEETKKSLTTRVNRLYTKSAWVENPATRQRHFISNVMVEATANPGEYQVSSYYLFKRSRGSTHEVEQMFGQREDIIRKEDGEWKILSRTVYPDQTVITTMNMSMFL